MPVVVVDTNVVVAGLLTHRDDSPVARMLDGLLAGCFAFAVSEPLLGEYHAVLHRPKLRAMHGLSMAELDALLVAVAQHAIVLSPGRTTLRAPDPGDQHLWELLASRDDLVLVSGDMRLLDSADFPARVWSPARFVETIDCH